MADLRRIFFSDRAALAAADQLLKAAGIRRDPHLDYLCGLYEESGALVAVGGCCSNTLRCLAVDPQHQGGGLLPQLLTHLMEVEQERGHTDLFLYTKPESARYFADLGFYTIAAVGGALVFMENQPDGFSRYLRRLREETDRAMRQAGDLSCKEVSAAAIVMNANPFTCGHQYLIEQAARRETLLHLFLVSEDVSLFPYAVRRQLVCEGIAHLPHVILHDSGPYIISQATFPSYFQKDEEEVSRGHALLDITVFRAIAAALGIRRRYAGEEPLSVVTRLYNQVMQEELPKAGIACCILPRFCRGGKPVSASEVRRLLKEHGPADALLQELVPASTLRWLRSPDAAPVLRRIRAQEEVRHH